MNCTEYIKINFLGVMFVILRNRDMNKYENSAQMDSTHENTFFAKKSESCFCIEQNTLMFVTVWSISLAIVQSKH